MIKIYNESCINIEKYLTEKCALVLTDPPYELGSFRKEIGKWEKFKVCESGIFDILFENMLDGAHIVCFSSNRTMYKFGNAIEKTGFEIRDTLIWQYKNQSIPRNMNVSKAIDCEVTYGKTSSKYMRQIEQEFGGDSYKIKGTVNTMFGDYKEFDRKEYTPITDEGRAFEGWGTNLAPNFEPIILARKPFKDSLAKNLMLNKTGALNIEMLKTLNENKYPSNILNFPKDKKQDFNTHPTVKPLSLIEYLILMTTNEGDLVVDPFLGSGTVALACKKLNRRFIGTEIDKKYCNIAEKRLNLLIK
jgi:DNA modification methylase